jgi:hypothetical protein
MVVVVVLTILLLLEVKAVTKIGTVLLDNDATTNVATATTAVMNLNGDNDDDGIILAARTML